MVMWEGEFPYLGYTGMCHWTGYGFFGLAVLNRVWYYEPLQGHQSTSDHFHDKNAIVVGIL